MDIIDSRDLVHYRSIANNAVLYEEADTSVVCFMEWRYS
jgi:hypothetical protein